MLKRGISSLYGGFWGVKAAAAAASAAVYLAVVIFSGGNAGEVVLLGAVLAVYIVLPGFLGVRLSRAARWPQGTAPLLALTLGAGFFAALYCVSVRLGILWLLCALPPVLACAQAALWYKERRAGRGAHKPLTARPSPQGQLLVLLFSALLLLFTFYGVAKNGHPLAVGDVLLNQDLLWNAGNAESFRLAFPPQDIRFVGVRLSYHYLTELLAGALSIVSGISPYNILAFYLQPFMLGALVLCLYRFGRIAFPQGRAKPALFTFSFFIFGCASLWKILPNGYSVFGNANIVHLVTNINSQATATILLCVFTGLFVHASRQKYRVGILYHLGMLAAFFMLCFAKGPLAALAAAAVCCVLIFGLFTRDTSLAGLLAGVGVAAIFLAVFFTVFSSGAADSMTFSAAGTLNKGYFQNILAHLGRVSGTAWAAGVPLLWLLQSFFVMPAQFPLLARGAAGDLRRLHRLPPERLLYGAMVLGGLAAFFLFDHPALSQTYFLYGALFFVNLYMADGASRLPEWYKKARSGKILSRAALALTAFCAAVGLATAGFLHVHMLGSGARQIARNLGIEAKYPYELVMTPDDEAGALWLRANTPQSAVFATNRIHTGGRREGISNLYSALSGRQGFMEGFQYAKTNMGVSAEVLGERMAVNSALFSARTPPREVLRLCRENGVDYLLFCAQTDAIGGSERQLSELELVWESPKLRIYALPPA